MVQDSFISLKNYVEREGFRGWDPYDGLTSKVFKSLPIVRKSRFARLAWIQFFKRSPFNFRKILLVPKNYNAKGIALFCTGYYNLYKISKDEHSLKKVTELADLLLELTTKGYAGSCWGYYFDWQARAFFQPGGTPTVVATSFVADALLNAYEITGLEKYKAAAVSSASFVVNDLNREVMKDGSLCFSYSPLDNSQVFNASLLGARLLARVYAITRNEELLSLARGAVKFACDHQQENGAWAYGNYSFHQWVDSFHTGFNLECIWEFQHYTGDTSFKENIEKGLHYYLQSFFTAEGIPKYYNNKTYPVDIHAPAQLIVTLARMQRLNEHSAQVNKVLHWTIQHMQHRKKGYFFYQKKKILSSKIPYMRWAQAWMFYAYSYYFQFNPLKK